MLDDGVEDEAPASGDGARRADVLGELRTATAPEHQAVEDTLALLDPELSRDRLAGVLARMHGFWQAAEAGLDQWFATAPETAARLRWPVRRRAELFAADLRTLGTEPGGEVPDLPPVTCLEDALGRMYVLEGSTLGGVSIDRHLSGLPHLAATGSLGAFSPYGSETGALWADYRRATRQAVTDGARADLLVAAARQTFAALAAWCAPVAAGTGAVGSR